MESKITIYFNAMKRNVATRLESQPCIKQLIHEQKQTTEPKKNGSKYFQIKKAAA